MRILTKIGYFEFYTQRMTGVNEDTGKGTKPEGASTFRIYPMGQIDIGSWQDDYATAGEFKYQGEQGYYWSATRWCSQNGGTAYNQRMYWLQAGYRDNGSTFGAAQANTGSFGYPVLPMWGN